MANCIMKVNKMSWLFWFSDYFDFYYADFDFFFKMNYENKYLLFCIIIIGQRHERELNCGQSPGHYSLFRMS